MDFRIEFYPKVGDGCLFEKEYPTQEQAETAMHAIADYTLTLHDCRLMPDWSNMGMVFMKDCAGQWVEIGEDGYEI